MEKLTLKWLQVKPLKLPTATIYSNGLLAFNKSAVATLGIKEGDLLRVAIDGTLDTFKNFYIQINKGEKDGKSVKVIAVGSSLAIKFKNVLELISVKEKKFKVIADVYESEPIFKLKKF